jgi:hypothetical protein
VGVRLSEPPSVTLGLFSRTPADAVADPRFEIGVDAASFFIASPADRGVLRTSPRMTEFV